MDVKDRAVEELVAARRRSLELLEGLSDDQLRRQHSPLMSPLVWDLAHIGNYEELWLVRAAGGMAALDPSLDDLYDAFRHARPDRPALPLLGPDAARAYIDRGPATGPGRRSNGLPFDQADPLLVGRLRGRPRRAARAPARRDHAGHPPADGWRRLPPRRPAVPAGGRTRPGRQRSSFPGGPFEMGTDDEAWAYDNERPPTSSTWPRS